jgi:predicted permease
LILVAVAIVASTAIGLGAERRWGDGAAAVSRFLIAVLLWFVLPFVSFFVLARLELDAGVGGGLVLGFVELGIVAALAFVIGRRVLRLRDEQTGALVLVSMLSNTGYLGVPLCAAALGTGAIGAAVAWDTVVSGPMFWGFGFAVGAALGTLAGGTPRERLRSFVVRNPPLVAVIAGLLAPDALAPDVLVDVAEVLVYAVLPVGFFILGVNLATEAEGGALAFPPPLTAPVGVALVLRLLVAPALMLGLSALVVDVPDAYLLQAAMPSGINSLIVAHAYGLDLRICASAIAWSTSIMVTIAIAVAAL